MTLPEIRGTIDAGPGGSVSSAWIEAANPVATIVVAHGAGVGMDHPFMTGFCRAIAELGVAAMRFNFPYMEKGRRSTDAAPVAIAAWRPVFQDAVGRSEGRPVFAAGKSYGGRMASMAVAEGMAAAGLVFLGYPLHPPGKPERLHDEHLGRIEVPMLFLQGTRDPFARPDLLHAVVERLGERRAELHEVEGGDHSFRVRGEKPDDRSIGASLAGVASIFVRRVAGGS